MRFRVLCSARRLVAAACFALLVVGVGRVAAQEALRVSLAGQEAAEARKRAASAAGYYNLKFGDWRMRFDSALGLEYDDNVRLSNQGRESDFILRPALSIQSTVPITQQNTFDFDVAGGYSYYVDHSSLSRSFLRPGSGLSFDIYVKDFVINLHDQVSVIQQSYANVGVSGTGDFGYFENTAGLGVTWDLNRLVIRSGYDYLRRLATTSGYEQQNVSEHLFNTSAALELNNVSSVGIEASQGLIAYDQNILTGGFQYSIGTFYQRQVSQFFTLRASAGYFAYSLDNLPTNSPANASRQLDGVYAMLSLDHLVNRFLNYDLQAGRQLQVGLFANALDLYYVRLTANWNIVREIPITTQFSYENGSQSGGLQPEKIERYGGGLSLSRQITQKLGASLSYNVYSRTSDLPGRDYFQNRVTLSLNYRF